MSTLVKIAAKVASEPFFDITSAHEMEEGGYDVRITEDPEDDYGPIEAEIVISGYHDKGEFFLNSVYITNVKGATDEAALEKWVASNEHDVARKVFQKAYR